MSYDDKDILDLNLDDDYDADYDADYGADCDIEYDPDYDVEITEDREPTGGKSGGKKSKSKNKTSPAREALSWILTFSLAILVALILKNFVIINATVPTGSMENTIQIGDNLFGYRLAYLHSEPKRGDIIIFYYPDNEEEKYVKRIIGLPGEKVTITEAQVFINGEELKEDYLKEEWVSATGPFEFDVPEGSYLVLGDNRNDSLDARYWKNKYVKKEKIIGKAEFIYFPFNRFGFLNK